jgi:hypothetical protein
MATVIQGKASLTLVKANGSFAYVYAGQPVPEGISSEDKKRLLDEGYLEKVEVEDVDAVQAAASAAGSSSTADEDDRPAKTAKVDAWVAYRVGQFGDSGFTADVAKERELSKAQLQDDAFIASLAQQLSAPAEQPQD